MGEGSVTYNQLEGLLRAAKIPNDEGTIRWLWGNLGGRTKDDEIPRRVFEQVMSRIKVEDIVSPRTTVPQPTQLQNNDDVPLPEYRNITPPRRSGSTTPARRQTITPRSHFDSSTSVGYQTAVSSPPPTIQRQLLDQSVTIRNLEERLSQYESNHPPSPSPVVDINQSESVNNELVVKQSAMIKLLEQTLQDEVSRRKSDASTSDPMPSPSGKKSGYADNHKAAIRHQQRVRIKELEDNLQHERRKSATPSRNKSTTKKTEYSETLSPQVSQMIAQQAEEIRQLEGQLSPKPVDKKNNFSSPGREVERLEGVVRSQAEELFMLREAYELLQQKTSEVEIQAADNAEVAARLSAVKKHLNQREKELSTYEEQGAGIQQELDGEGAKLQKERTELNRLKASLAEKEHILERMKEHATGSNSSLKLREIEVAQREGEIAVAEGRLKRREQSLLLRENSVSESERNLSDREQALQEAIRQFNSKAPQPQQPVLPTRQSSRVGGTPPHFCCGDTCPLHKQDHIPTKKVNLLQKQSGSGYDKQKLAAEQNELVNRKLKNREAVLEEREAAAAEREQRLLRAEEAKSRIPQQLNELQHEQMSLSNQRDELDAKEAKLIALEREIETQLREYAGVKGKIAEMKSLERSLNEKQRKQAIAEKDLNDRLKKMQQQEANEKKEWNAVAKKSRAMEAELRTAQEKLEQQERMINKRMRETDKQQQKSLQKLKQREDTLIQREKDLQNKEDLIAEGKHVLDKIATEQMKKDDGIASRNLALEEGEDTLRKAIVSVLPGTNRGSLLRLGVDELASKAAELIRASAGVLRTRDDQHSAQAATVSQQIQSIAEREDKLNSKQADVEKQLIELKKLQKDAEAKEVQLLQEELKVLTEKEAVSVRLEEVEMRERQWVHGSCRLSTTSATG